MTAGFLGADRRTSAVNATAELASVAAEVPTEVSVAEALGGGSTAVEPSAGVAAAGDAEIVA